MSLQIPDEQNAAAAQILGFARDGPVADVELGVNSLPDSIAVPGRGIGVATHSLPPPGARVDSPWYLNLRIVYHQCHDVS
jgi:hypothetical protein